MDLYPLLLTPVYKDLVWGGSRLRTRFGRALPGPRCAESWEIADRPEGMSVAANGPLKGTSLRLLIEQYGAQLLGSACDPDRFPLLIKILDARERLSVQVHPNERTAGIAGGEPKTEMWYVLEAAPTARIFVGFKPRVRPHDLERAMRRGGVGDLLRSFPARPGDAFYIPGGTVHAIGEGCLLLEVQQSSDTTYRLYDWDRVGADGKPRTLHPEQALRSVEWAGSKSPRTRARRAAAATRNRLTGVVASPFFVVERLRLCRPMAVQHNAASFHAFFAVRGNAVLAGGGVTLRLRSGVSCLVPASLAEYRIEPRRGAAELLRVRLPDAR